MSASTLDVVSGTDRDLERRVTNYLWGRHVPALRNVLVEATDGVVTLRGQVRSFYEKQLCHNCCRRVAGVRQLVDDVDVMSAEPMAMAGA
jgi:osmotically-inducible protein OsmY